MKPPTAADIKTVLGNYYLLRHENFNGRTAAQVTWAVAERNADVWRKERDFNSKREAQAWLLLCAK